MRTDSHSPSRIDPSQYAYLGSYYLGDSVEVHEMMDDIDDALWEELRANLGKCPHPSIERCDCCGAIFTYGTMYRHIPSNQILTFGTTCSDNTVGLNSKKDLEISRLRAKVAAAKLAAKVAAERKVNRFALRALCKSNAVVFNALRMRRGNEFFLSVLNGYIARGKLSDKQMSALEKSVERQLAWNEKKAAEPEPTQPLTAGRQLIAGEVLSLKYQDSYYGETYKMLVRTGDGNKVWGSVPAALDTNDREIKVGDSIQMTAGVKVSDNDKAFGFFSRPSKASFI